MNGTNIAGTLSAIINSFSIQNVLFAIVGLFLGIGVGIYINVVFYAKKNRDLGKLVTGALCVGFGLIGIVLGAFISHFAPTTFL